MDVSPSQRTSQSRSASHARTAIFAIPKPFVGHVGDIQHNAFRSWKALEPHGVKAFIFGDEAGVEENCRDVGLEFLGPVRRNGFGTPLVSDAFATVARRVEAAQYCYANSDIIFFDDLPRTLDQLNMRRFLLVGRRTDLDVKGRFAGNSDWQGLVKEQIALTGRLHPPYGIDYFVLSRAVMNSLKMPEIPVGRGLWDNWMIYQHRRRWIPVVDATPAIVAVHQNHDYSHVEGGRRSITYGDEVRNNVRTFGSDFVQMGISDATHVIRNGRVSRNWSEEHIGRMVTTSPRVLPIVGSVLRRLWPYKVPQGPQG